MLQKHLSCSTQDKRRIKYLAGKVNLAHSSGIKSLADFSNISSEIGESVHLAGDLEGLHGTLEVGLRWFKIAGTLETSIMGCSKFSKLSSPLRFDLQKSKRFLC